MKNKKGTGQTSNIDDISSRGFALLVAIIFVTVMLSFGLALGSLAYKQESLASNAIESQYAFYAADAGLECALYADQQQNLFAYTPDMNASAPVMDCDNSAPINDVVLSHTDEEWVISSRLSLDSGKQCVDITVYKPSSGANTTYLFSQGYDVPCSVVANPNGVFVARGINAHY